MLSAVESILKKYQMVRGQTSTEAHRSNSHNIYYLYLFRKCDLANLTERTELTEQTKHNRDFSLIREIAGDILGAISLFAILFLTIIFGGILQ